MGLTIIKEQDHSEGWTLRKSEPCRDPEHHFPHHIVIPFGAKGVNVCPSCGHTETVNNNVTYFLD